VIEVGVDVDEGVAGHELDGVVRRRAGRAAGVLARERRDGEEEEGRDHRYQE